MNVRPAQPGKWPPGQYEDEFGDVVKHGQYDDGTDDDTVINTAIKEDNMDFETIKI